jgi:hypothetical protein
MGEAGVGMSMREGEERGAGGGFSTHLLSHCFGSHNLVTSSEKNPRISLSAGFPTPEKKENGGGQVCVAIEAFFDLENGEGNFK